MLSGTNAKNQLLFRGRFTEISPDVVIIENIFSANCKVEDYCYIFNRTNEMHNIKSCLKNRCDEMLFN